MDKHAQGYRQKMMSKRVMNCYNILLVFTKLMLQFDMINDVNNIVRFNHFSIQYKLEIYLKVATIYWLHYISTISINNGP